MAESLIDRAWRVTTPDEIELELAEIWRQVGQQRRVARAVMSNLVVVRQRPATGNGRSVNADAVARELPLDEVVAQHPSRVIVIQVDPEQRDAGEPSAVSVGVITFGPPQARFGIEQVIVQAPAVEESLASIVRRLLRGDVPTSVWCTDDLADVPPLDGIVWMARQFVYDSRCWRDVRAGVRAVAKLHGRLDLADLNWRRLAPLRQALIHACRESDADSLRLADIEITHRPGERALAWLMVGWFSARVGWTRDASPRVTESRDGSDLIRVAVGKGLNAALDEHRVVVSREGGLPFAVSVPPEREADAVAAELRNLGRDVCLQDVLGALEERLLYRSASNHRFQQGHLGKDFIEGRAVDRHLSCLAFEAVVVFVLRRLAVAASAGSARSNRLVLW